MPTAAPNTDTVTIPASLQKPCDARQLASVI